MRTVFIILLISSTSFAESITVGVVDTGIYPHKDFVSQILIIDEKAQNIIGSKQLEDTDGHGTSVAGIINRYAPEVKLVPLKVQTPEKIENVNSNLKGTVVKNLGIIKVIDFAIKHKIRILNLSVVISKNSKELQDAINKASKNNILIVAGAGNLGNNLDDKELTTYPCGLKMDNVICVSSYLQNPDSKKMSHGLSNYGSNFVEAWARGSGVFSQDIPSNDNYSMKIGSSFATPKITALAANILKDNPSLTAKDLKLKVLESLEISEELKKISVTGKYLPAPNNDMY